MYIEIDPIFPRIFIHRSQIYILGATRMNRIKNVDIRRTLEVEKSITDVIKERRLRWFGHVCRNPVSSMVYQAYKQDFNNTRPCGRPPKRWKDMIRQDTGVPLETAERRTMDRAAWRNRWQGRARGRFLA